MDLQIKRGDFADVLWKSRSECVQRDLRVALVREGFRELERYATSLHIPSHTSSMFGDAALVQPFLDHVPLNLIDAC